MSRGVGCRGVESATRIATISHRDLPSFIQTVTVTYPRAHLVDEAHGGYYHCISRCVRRAFLCGVDRLTGRSFEHRKDWIERRILAMGRVFSIRIVAYSVMSNHYHLVLKTEPEIVATWSDFEVARRWLRLTKHEQVKKEQIELLTSDASRIRTLRQRLASLSWFMRYINEPAARKANAEDDCTGRFWEGRFKSIALLDRSAVLNCMAYVDLNPVRVNPRLDPLTSRNTSLRHRVEHHNNRLLDLSTLEITLDSYVKLLEWTVDHERNADVELVGSVREILDFGQSAEEWRTGVQAQSLYYRAYGLAAALKDYVKKLGQTRIRCAVQLA